MFKLVRNCMAEQTIVGGDKRPILWSLIEGLERLRVKKNFVTHKLTKRHVQFDENKMNVPLAAQTISKSVANSMIYLKNKRITEFENCEGTANFILIIDILFDIMNSNKVQENNIFNT